MVTGRESPRPPRGGLVQIISSHSNSCPYIYCSDMSAEPYNLRESLNFWQINQCDGIADSNDLCHIHNRFPHERCSCSNKGYVEISDAYHGKCPDFGKTGLSIHNDKANDWHDDRTQSWHPRTDSLFEHVPIEWQPSHDVRDDRRAQYHIWIDRSAAKPRDYTEDVVDFSQPFCNRRAICKLS